MELQKNEPLLPFYVKRGVNLVKGRGCRLFDQNGEAYLDLMSNYGSAIFGHDHPRINAELGWQIESLVTLHSSFSHPSRLKAARKLTEKIGREASFYFSNSGTEANETALKLAAFITGRKRFISCRNGYHGKTLGALSATHASHYRQPFEPLLWDFEFVPFNDPAALAAAAGPDTAAFLVEPIQGEGGVNVPSADYLGKVAAICAEKGILLIVDEIQTGCGRTGRFIDSQDIPFDILCLGKGLAGGIACGVTALREGLASKLGRVRGMHTSTFGGNPLQMAGMNAALGILDEGMMREVGEKGRFFMDSLRELGSPLVREVKGRGLMIGVEVDGHRDLILKKLQERKVLAIPAADNVVRFLPPYIIAREEIEAALGIFWEVLKEVEHVSLSDAAVR